MITYDLLLNRGVTLIDCYIEGDTLVAGCVCLKEVSYLQLYDGTKPPPRPLILTLEGFPIEPGLHGKTNFTISSHDHKEI